MNNNSNIEQLSLNPTQAKVHGLSVQVGELFADLYRSAPNGLETEYALNAYKNLRRILPREHARGRHIGRRAAWHATQGNRTR
jgi:hypothetical protein